VVIVPETVSVAYCPTRETSIDAATPGGFFNVW
jgi:hypothetical protein